MTQTRLNSKPNLVNIAKPIPKFLALLRCDSGKRPTRIEIKIILSIPSTISRASSVPNAIHASGLAIQSNIVCPH
ncbi:hypothetical protein LP43_1062 [Methylophaga thiooxydans]|uniref:Uncharacterized protein n=1 Tax=Methylophaga thiooxydans TaxID=392484 RepID=A0A0A0BHM6_9GAMM|nr:hypothetical protein LP43_1062 [Methylophaga thiooxydans]